MHAHVADRRHPAELMAWPAVVNFHDVRPRAVVRCRTASDVAETLRFAARAGLPLAVRGGGHCFAGRSSTSGVVLDTTPMGAVTVSGDLATVGVGCRLGALYDPDGVFGS
jgi:FAD/FMN-containing dehydrogenase